MKIKKVQASTAQAESAITNTESSAIDTVVQNPCPDAYSCAIECINNAIDCLAECKDNEVALDSIANLSVVLLDLKASNGGI